MGRWGEGREGRDKGESEQSYIRSPPFFVLQFAFSIIQEERHKKKQGRSGKTYYVNDVSWTWGGGGGVDAHVQ